MSEIEQKGGHSTARHPKGSRKAPKKSPRKGSLRKRKSGRVSRKITLIDGIERNKASPETFQLPSQAAIARIRPGASVKIGAERAGKGEHFWVLVTAKDGKNITGTVDNNLIEIPWPVGREVKFQSRHVLDIFKRAPTKRKSKKRTKTTVKKISKRRTAKKGGGEVVKRSGKAPRQKKRDQVGAASPPAPKMRSEIKK